MFIFYLNIYTVYKYGYPKHNRQKMNTDFAHINAVTGWLQPQALNFTSFYTEHNLKGQEYDSLEIGVYHGKFFLALENMTPEKNRAIAVDIFDDYEKSVDTSGRAYFDTDGKSSYDQFVSNIDQFAVANNRVLIVKGDSLDVDYTQLGLNQFGLISIDGCHTARHTYSDLQLASKLISHKGLVVVDDIFNIEWPGVASGACEFFSSNHSGKLVPFALGFNKMFCCSIANYEQAIKQIETYEDELHDGAIALRKYTEFAGHRVILLAPFSW
jgi:hypothetical protein